MVQTPVGARCPGCARLVKVPTYEVSGKYYVRGIFTGLGTAIVCGMIWSFIGSLLPFNYLDLLLSPLAAYVITETISWSVNQKRGTGLVLVACIMLVISFAISILFMRFILFHPISLSITFIDGLAIILGILVAVARLR